MAKNVQKLYTKGEGGRIYPAAVDQTQVINGLASVRQITVLTAEFN